MKVNFNTNSYSSTVSPNKQNRISKNNLQANNIDTVSFSGADSKNEEKGLTKAEKQNLLKSARQTAAGWSILGGPISTLYFALRSDSTVADKYDLDKKKDADFIREIKRQQAVQTVPSIFLCVGGIAAFGYNILKHPSTINVD